MRPAPMASPNRLHLHIYHLKVNSRWYMQVLVIINNIFQDSTHELYCTERGSKLKIQNVLSWCVQIMDEMRDRDSPTDEDSDEEEDLDISEEDLNPDEVSDGGIGDSVPPALAVPVIILILLVLIAGVIFHRFYKNRKNFRR